MLLVLLLASAVSFAGCGRVPDGYIHTADYRYTLSQKYYGDDTLLKIRAISDKTVFDMDDISLMNVFTTFLEGQLSITGLVLFITLTGLFLSLTMIVMQTSMKRTRMTPEKSLRLSGIVNVRPSRFPISSLSVLSPRSYTIRCNFKDF